MAVGLQHVETPVEVIVEEEDAERTACKRLGAPIPSTIASSAKIEVIALADVDGGHLVGEVADQEAEVVVVAVMAGVDAHGAGRVAGAIVGDSDQSSADLLEGDGAVRCRRPRFEKKKLRTVSLATSTSIQPSRSTSNGAIPSALAIGRPGRRIGDPHPGSLRDFDEGSIPRHWRIARGKCPGSFAADRRRGPRR